MTVVVELGHQLQMGAEPGRVGASAKIHQGLLLSASFFLLSWRSVAESLTHNLLVSQEFWLPVNQGHKQTMSKDSPTYDLFFPI